MVMQIIQKVFGNKSDRDVKRLRPIVDEINEIYETLRDKPDEWFPQRTAEFKAELQAYLEEIDKELDRDSMEPELYKKEHRKLLDKKLDEMLPEAFAMVKEACRRHVGKSWDVSGLNLGWEMVPYDVQLIGAIVLHQGKIAEMATGEGKTLVATMPLYLNALTGRGAHLVTVNDYLARRDAQWMGKIYEFLGLTVGCIQNEMNNDERRTEYTKDITYGTNNEFGFDYLRDNMSIQAEDQVQRGFAYAIVDEVDSVLIDEARTPLIISGPVESSLNFRFTDMRPLVANVVKRQNQLVATLITEGEKLFEEGNTAEASEKLLMAYRGAPRNKRLMKLFKEKGVRQIVDDREMIYRRDKNLQEVDENLYFTIDEREHTVYLNEPGLKMMSTEDQKLFEVPDITDGLHQIDSVDVYSPPIANIIRQQSSDVSRLINEAKKLLEQGKDTEAYEKLLIAYQAGPKFSGLADVFSDKDIYNAVMALEADHQKNGKNSEVDRKLYYTVDMRKQKVTLNELGKIKLSSQDQNQFESQAIQHQILAFDGGTIYTPEEKNRAKEELYQLHAEKSEKNHAINQLLRAFQLFEKDVEYVVQDGKVLIVDEFTGRLMPGRRYSDGLHQAIEAKENVTIEGETQTLATITLQNFFRMYEKLSGMTGTAETESEEFWEIYKLDVVVIPTNQPVRRIDYDDIIYRTRREKYNSIIEEIVRLHRRNTPILVGTISVEVSETLSRMLKRQGIGHSVLNAKYHQQEAEIVAKAGMPGSVTIATNMAGRGTDIKLADEVVKTPYCMLVSRVSGENECPFYKELHCNDDVPCGLHIIGTDLHESRRIDRQLRGRSGRQGDPGASTFYLSLEDDMMRIFGGGRIERVMDTLGWKEGEAINHRMVTRAIERARKQVEYNNFSIRKNLVEYDNVMNSQREVIYGRRTEFLKGKNLKEEAQAMVREIIDKKVWEYCPEKTFPEEWNFNGLREELRKLFLLDVRYSPEEFEKLRQHKLIDDITDAAIKIYDDKEQILGEEIMRRLERFAFLSVYDTQWKEHLYEMDQLKTGIGLRAYGQRDPVIEYKKEAYSAFEEMMERIDQEVIGMIYRMKPMTEPTRMPQGQMVAAKQSAVGMGVRAGAEASAREQYSGPMAEAAERGEEKKKPIRVTKTPGRNDPCPCGSGKKYKYCHGR
jgi:preprotein translocase subunit SecA